METTLLDKNSMLSHNTEQWKVLGLGVMRKRIG
jgi:hypothetical protein